MAKQTTASKVSKPSYLYSIVSIALVLFMLGLLGIFLLYAQALSRHFKENVEITLVLRDSIPEVDVYNFQRKVALKPYYKAGEYVSKDEAARRFFKKTDEDPEVILGYNPLFSSLSLYLKAQYANNDSLQWIKKELTGEAYVKDVFYQETLIDLINTNIQRIGIVLLILSILFGFVAFTLIDNTIKLAMYSNRFLIKSMQLVGATRNFITKPFLSSSIVNGIISGALAALLLMLVVFLMQRNIPDLAILYDPIRFVILGVVIVFIGIFISWWSTRTSVYKYLQLQLDELY